MEEGCFYIIAILIGIGIVLAIIFYVLMGIAFGFAYFGLFLVLLFDTFASAFTWVGVSGPVAGWSVLGLFAGLTVGLAKGLKKAGRRSDTWKVYGGAGALSALLALGAYAAYPANYSSAAGSNLNLSTASNQATSTNAVAANTTGNMNAATGSTRARAVQPGASTNVGYANSGNFEVRINSGSVSSDSVILSVRETSLNFNGPWISWRQVVGASYVADASGNRYPADVSQSSGWSDGYVRPGGYREGRMVFSGRVPRDARRLTLYFAFVPSDANNGFASVSFNLR